MHSSTRSDVLVDLCFNFVSASASAAAVEHLSERAVLIQELFTRRCRGSSAPSWHLRVLHLTPVLHFGYRPNYY